MESFWIAFIGVIGALAGVTITLVMGLLTAKTNTEGKHLQRQLIEKSRSDTYKKVLLPICSRLSNEEMVIEVLNGLLQDKNEFVVVPSTIEYHFYLYKNCAEVKYKKKAYEIFKKEVYDTKKYYEKHNNFGKFGINRTFRPYKKQPKNLIFGYMLLFF